MFQKEFSSFSQMYQSTVASGEQSGFLDKVLENLADYSERQYEARRNVEMALVYPVILTGLAFLLVGLLMVYVVPDMVGMLTDMDRELPLSTQVLIALSETIRDFWWLVLSVLGLTGLIIKRLLNQPNIRLAWDRQKLNLPFLTRISRNSNSARYANTLSILTSSGIPPG